MIRPARADDAAALAAIYGPQVLHGTASFETDAPDAAEMAARLARVQARGWPWLVAERDGAVLGYAYAMQFRDRPAYAGTCENSIYVAAEAQRLGVGSALLRALIDAARDCGFGEMIAVLGDGPNNPASLALHRGCGFVDAGHLRRVGCKFGRWLDVMYLQRGV